MIYCLLQLIKGRVRVVYCFEMKQNQSAKYVLHHIFFNTIKCLQSKHKVHNLTLFICLFVYIYEI